MSVIDLQTRIRNKARGKTPVANLPAAKFSRWGFGDFPVRADEWQPRIDAVTTLLAILDGDLAPSRQDPILSAFSMTKAMFSRIVTADKYDWFTVARQLGFPSPALAKEISARIYELRRGVMDHDPALTSSALNALQEMPVAEMLDCYLDVAVRAKHPIDETGFAYILWSTSERDLLRIGATEETVDDVQRQLRRDYRDHDPYGVVSAYLVHDPALVQGQLQKLFRNQDCGDGFYRIDPSAARPLLERCLMENDQIRLSPWHGDDPEEVQETKCAMGH